MNMISLIVSFVVVAVAGFFLAPTLSLDSSSFVSGAFAAVLVAAILSVALPSASAGKTAKPGPIRRSSTVAAKQTSGDTKTLYVGNLAFKANRGALTKLFSEYGNVVNVRIATDRNTRKPKGYGFVEMSGQDADKAASALDGKEFFGRTIKVAEAKE
ncbi:MAG: RNA-binding protein [Gammaproteobacteria bacterium]|nr:RNA-binding protein [Gammaproteobacteria bacterium]